MTDPRFITNRQCMSCDKPIVLTVHSVAHEGTERQKWFCCDKCSDDWWNSQSFSPLYEKIQPGWKDSKNLKRDREMLITLQKADPWRHGYVPPHWEMADKNWLECKEMLISGGNRAGKTLWAGREIIKTLVAKENANAICCHTSRDTSVEIQQPAIYHFLPPELRATKKSRVAYLNYSRKNGFTDRSFILPNGSRCSFLNYTQDIATIEGREADIIWCDELVPQSWIDTLRPRLWTRKGKLLVTQTPLEGVASVYKEFTAGGKIIEWGDADLLEGRQAFPTWPAGKAPKVMIGMNPQRRTVWFFSADNPFNPYSEVKEKLTGAPTGQILTRAYGWATDTTGKAFTRFNPQVHCIPREKIPPGGSTYMIIDPAGRRNWFILWANFYEDGKIVVIKEFPDFRNHGEWALSGDKPDGKKGPAQMAGAGKGFPEWRQVFRDVESELGCGEPVARLIDPKAGGTPSLSLEGGTTLIDLLATDSDHDTGMYVIPAPGVVVDQRSSAINDALAYDATKPLSTVNEPRLYIVDDCDNLIWCLAEHTGMDGDKGASKDPIDCLGMLLTSSLEYVGSGGFSTVGGGSY